MWVSGIELICWVAPGLLALGFLLVPRLRATGRAAPLVQVDPARLSVVIPARNEAHNLPALLESISAQPVKVREVLVVDDGSEDGTADLAAGFGARVLTSKPLPEGWRGKPWACHQGAKAATGDWLLFLDADTRFEKGGLGGLLSSYPGGAYSLGCYHAVEEAYEQMSLFFNLNMTVGTVPSGLFGPVLLVDRQSYEKAGGHESVRGRVLENTWLGRRFREVGVPVRSAPGRGRIRFRMYPGGLGELVEGWVKGFASGAGQTPRGVLMLSVLWMVGLVFPVLMCLLTLEWGRWGSVYLAGAAQVWLFSRWTGSFSAWAALAYPVPLLFFFGVFGWSALKSGKAVTWKGREIRAD